MLTWSIPAAPRLRLTVRKAWRMRRSSMRPVKECTFCFLGNALSPGYDWTVDPPVFGLLGAVAQRSLRGVGRGSHRRCSGVGHSGLTGLVSRVGSVHSLRFLLSSRRVGTTLDLLTSPKRGELDRPSPPHRLGRPFSRRLIGRLYPHGTERCGTSSVTFHRPLSQGDAATHQDSQCRHPQHPHTGDRSSV